MAKLGIAAGLTLGVRVGGLLIFGYLGLLLLLFALWRWLETRRSALCRRRAWRAALACAAAGGVSPIR